MMMVVYNSLNKREENRAIKPDVSYESLQKIKQMIYSTFQLHGCTCEKIAI